MFMMMLNKLRIHFEQFECFQLPTNEYAVQSIKIYCILVRKKSQFFAVKLRCWLEMFFFSSSKLIAIFNRNRIHTKKKKGNTFPSFKKFRSAFQITTNHSTHTHTCKTHTGKCINWFILFDCSFHFTHKNKQTIPDSH